MHRSTTTKYWFFYCVEAITNSNQYYSRPKVINNYHHLWAYTFIQYLIFLCFVWHPSRSQEKTTVCGINYPIPVTECFPATLHLNISINWEVGAHFIMKKTYELVSERNKTTHKQSAQQNSALTPAGTCLYNSKNS